MTERRSVVARLRSVDGEERVTSLELFFDLVFVVAITQVSALLVADPSVGGLGRGFLVLALVWWAWVAYAWLTNAVDPEEGAVRLAMFVAMAAMLVVSLAVPRAFGRDAWIFAGAYATVRLAHIGLFLLAGRGDPAIVRATLRLSAATGAAAVLLLIGAGVGSGARLVVWTAAVLLDYGGTFLGGTRGWRIAAAHFAERHGLIVLIALGEAIVSFTVGADAVPLDARAMGATVLGLATAACFWWAYFDVVAPVAERRLVALQGEERVRLARDSFSYLHLPMVAGIELYAFGAKEALAHVHTHTTMVEAAALAAGPALYLAGLVAFRLRNLGTLNRQRSVATVALMVFALVGAHRLAPLVDIGAVAAAMVALIAYEALRFRHARHRVRHPQAD